jgi:hypothetical protein|tara:strand:+ start:143 stop:316 length:174 start_codon:yes stop_codon:yes gene_type:complete
MPVELKRLMTIPRTVEAAWILKPATVPALVPSNSMIDVLTKSGSVVPSMTTASVMIA